MRDHVLDAHDETRHARQENCPQLVGADTCIFCGQNLIAREQIWVVPSKFAGGEGGTPKGYRGAGASEGVIDVEAE